MNVFVLNTGRCGSTTFIKACSHISNFSSAHESLVSELGDARLAYPVNHIEADNRLSWFLGRLDEKYGDSAFYVHLTRNKEKTAKSFARRYSRGIIDAYANAVIMRRKKVLEPIEVCRDYCETVDANIRTFLKDKSRKLDMSLESAASDFERFWAAIGATGDFEKAIKEFDVNYNASKPAGGNKSVSDYKRGVAARIRKIIGA